MDKDQYSPCNSSRREAGECGMSIAFGKHHLTNDLTSLENDSSRASGNKSKLDIGNETTINHFFPEFF